MMTAVKKYIIAIRSGFRGYTIIELIMVSTLVVILAVMAVGSTKNFKRFATEDKALTRLRELSDAQERYRYSSDPTVNIGGTYGTFDELQLAGFIQNDYSPSDVKSHTVNAFIPFYRLEITKSPSDQKDEPDASMYFVAAYPQTNRWNLKTFFMFEDGEILQPDGLIYRER